MDNKGLLHDMGGWSQFFFFFFLFFSGLIITSLVLSLIIDFDSLQYSASTVRLAQAIQALGMFLFPALAFSFLCQSSIKTYLKIDTDSNLKFLLLAIVLIIVIQPFISMTSYYNGQMILPESLGSLESWMREKESSAEKTIKLLFDDKTMTGLIANLLVVAVIAGLVEEFFFRGCLQQIIQKIVKNSHVAIWIAAVIFSAMHFQFYGFIPRVLLGALLGYLFFWSGNIWVPVIIHTIYNAANVIITHLYYETPFYNEMENYNFTDHILPIVLSFLLTLVVIIFLYRNKTIKLESEK